MTGIRIAARGAVAGRGLLVAVLLTPALALAASSHGGGHGDEHAEPVPTGAALTERCAEYAEQLAFTREQLKRRNILGRWNLVVSEHRKRERFHDRYCSGDAASHDAPHGTSDAPHGTSAAEDHSAPTAHGSADH